MSNELEKNSKFRTDAGKHFFFPSCRELELRGGARRERQGRHRDCTRVCVCMRGQDTGGKRSLRRGGTPQPLCSFSGNTRLLFLLGLLKKAMGASCAGIKQSHMAWARPPWRRERRWVSGSFLGDQWRVLSAGPAIFPGAWGRHSTATNSSAGFTAVRGGP